jgi:hypothetical protein
LPLIRGGDLLETTRAFPRSVPCELIPVISLARSRVDAFCPFARQIIRRACRRAPRGTRRAFLVRDRRHSRCLKQPRAHCRVPCTNSFSIRVCVTSRRIIAHQRHVPRVASGTVLQVRVQNPGVLLSLFLAVVNEMPAVPRSKGDKADAEILRFVHRFPHAHRDSALSLALLCDTVVRALCGACSRGRCDVRYGIRQLTLRCSIDQLTLDQLKSANAALDATLRGGCA